MTDSLSSRAERAGPEETRGLLEELARRLWEWNECPGGVDPEFWVHRWIDFRKRLDCEAYLDAVMMLAEAYRRVEFGWYEEGGGWAYLHTAQDKVFEAEAATPELALIAAIAKALT